MPSRADLQALLEKTLGSTNVYFQPPESLKFNYPAIVFKLDNLRNDFADDSVYRQSWYYQVIVIDKKSDCVNMKKVSMLPGIRFVQSYTSDNLNHYVFTIYY